MSRTALFDDLRTSRWHADAARFEGLLHLVILDFMPGCFHCSEKGRLLVYSGCGWGLLSVSDEEASVIVVANVWCARWNVLFFSIPHRSAISFR